KIPQRTAMPERLRLMHFHLTATASTIWQAMCGNGVWTGLTVHIHRCKLETILPVRVAEVKGSFGAALTYVTGRIATGIGWRPGHRTPPTALPVIWDFVAYKE